MHPPPPIKPEPKPEIEPSPEPKLETAPELPRARARAPPALYKLL